MLPSGRFALYGPASAERFWRATLAFAKRRPFATNIGLCLAVAGVSDAAAQRAEKAAKAGKAGGFDFRRSATMCGFGLFMGILHWNLYMHAFPRLWPYAGTFNGLSLRQKARDFAGQRVIAQQVAFDLGLWMPLVYFPIFYMFQAGMRSQESTDLELLQIASEAMQNYKKTFVEDNVASLGVWIPGDVLMFTVPAWLRMPALYGVSFFWLGLVSSTRAGEQDVDSWSE